MGMETFASEEAMVVGGSRRPAGVFVSPRCGLALVLLAVVLTIGVALIVYFAVMKEPGVSCGPDGVSSRVTASPQVEECVKECSSIISTPKKTDPVVTSAPPNPPKPNMRLPGSLLPYRYDVELKPDIYRSDPKDFEYEGTVKVSFSCVVSTSVIILHKNKLNVTGYSLAHADGTTGSPSAVNQSFDAVTQFLRFGTSSALAAGRNYTLTISFKSQLLDDLVGLYYSSYLLQNGTRRYIATSHMEPTDARKVFPCFDEPAMKAVFAVSLWRKPHMTALSNMPVSSTENAGDWVIDKFQPTPPMSTYLLAFIICDFVSVSDVTQGNTTIRVWTRAESIGQAAYALQAGKRITEAFEIFFGQKFPLPKQDMIAIPDFAAGAMENWGLITYRETALLYDPNYASASNKQRVAVVVSHELAHQWFGNLVSPEWWDDLWLNEGFATYVEYIGVREIEPTWQMMTQFLVEDIFPVKVTDSLSTSHPIYVPVSDPDEINEIFDSISYAKGGAILSQIWFALGDEVFSQGIKNYLSGRKFGNANKGHLWEAWNEVAKQRGVPVNVTDVMDTWTNQMGYPLISASCTGQSCRLTQEHFLLDKSKPTDPRYPSPYGFKWEVPVTYTTDLNPDFDQTYRNVTWMSKNDQQKILNIKYQNWFIMNVGSYGFYRVNYDDQVWSGIVNQLTTNHEVIHEHNRGQLLDDAFNLVKAGYLDIARAMDVTRYLCNEQAYVPLYTGLGALSEIDGLLEKSAIYGQYSMYMKDLLTSQYESTGGFNDAGSSHLDQLKGASVVSRACFYDIGDCRIKAKQAFDDWMKNDTPISTNLRSIAYCYGVRLGGAAEWEFVYQKFKNQTNVATEAIKLLNAMSCTQQLWLLNRMLNYSLNPSEIRRQDAVSAIVYVSNNPLGKYLAWNFVRANWDSMYRDFGGGSFSFSNLVSGVLRSFNTPYELSEVMEFGVKNSDKLGSARRALEQAKERIVNNIDFLAKNEQKIARWLNSQVGKSCDASAKPSKPSMRLPGTLKPYHYDVEIRPDIYKPDPADFEFNGTVKISFTCFNQTSVITLHNNSLSVSSYSLAHADGTQGSPSITGHKYDPVTYFLQFDTNAALVPGRNYTITIAFSSRLRNDLAGLYYSSYKLENGTVRYIATTQMEPTDARKAFPCFDEPAMKAVFSVSLWRKPHMVALSNMPVTSTVIIGDWVVDRFQPTLPMSTYLLAIIVCDFVSVDVTTRGGTRVSVWARPESINQAQYALYAGGNITEYFEDYFGEKYPLPKQDMIAIPDFAAGAMENWGLITYRETALLYDPNYASASNKQRVAVVVAHELAHQWFGNLVSPEWWDDLWLNEGFATYMEYIGVERIEPTWEMMTQILVEDVFSVKLDDSLATSHPVYVPLNDPDEINEIFDSISYAKGGTIIRQIRFAVGDEVFSEGLKNYLRERRLGNANKNHLWEAWSRVAQATGVRVNVSAVMDTWTNQMGYPLITVNRTVQRNLLLTQEHFLLDRTKPTDPRYPSPYGFQWEVPLTYTTDKNPNFNQTYRDVTWMGQTEKQKSLTFDYDNWFIVNVGSYGFFRVNYPDDVWDGLVSQLTTDHEVIHENNRGQLLDDSFNLAKAGYIDITRAMDVTRYLCKEQRFVPLSVGLGALSEIDGLLERTAIYGDYTTYMKDLLTSQYANIGGFNDEGSSHIDQLKRAMIVSRACAYDIGDCRVKAKQAFDDWMRNSKPISTNLRNIAYCYGVRLGGANEWEFVYQKFKNQTNVATESIKLLNAMSCTQQQWLLNRMLSYSLISTEIRRQDAVSAIVYVSNNPLGKYMAWNFVRANWDTMFNNFGGGSFSFSNLVTGVLKSFNTPYELSEVIAFGEKNNDKLGSARRALEQAKERILNNINFLAKNEQKIALWLTNQSQAGKTCDASPKPSKPDMRLPDSLVPYHYDVELRPDIYKSDPKDFEFNGTVKISFTCKNVTSVITMHNNNLSIGAYSLTYADGSSGSLVITDLKFDPVTQFLAFHTSRALESQRNYTITISFSSKLRNDLSGLYYSSYKLKNGTERYIATSQMEPTDARKTFPCFDEPAMKAVFTVSLWRKLPMRSLSNMPVKVTDTAGDWVIDRYQPTLPMSTYLLAFIVCDFINVTVTTSGGTRVSVWAQEESIDQAQYALYAGGNITEYFEQYFGEAYPLPKQDMIAIPDFAAGAMENWGLITYRETALLYDKNYASASNKQRVAVVVSHELAHQWFGNLVSPEWWDDLWLNEGFASYVEYLGVDRIEPTWEMMTQILLEDVFAVKRDDSLATSHPIYVPVNDPYEINEIFDSISYAKGASIIRQIQFVLGDDAFSTGLRNYLTERRLRNANKGHLWDAWDNVATQRGMNINVSAIMDTWTKQMGYPLITVICNGTRTCRLSQEHFLLDKTKPIDPRYPSPYGFKWEVPLTYTTDKTKNFNVNGSSVIWMSSAEATKSLSIDFTDWFVINVGSYGFYRVNYENSVWDKLVQQLTTDYEVIHENNRGQLLDDAFNLVKAGYLDIAKAMDLTRYLGKETRYVPLATGFSALSEIDSLLEQSSVYGRFENYMRTIVGQQYAQAGVDFSFNEGNTSHVDQLRNVLIVARACAYDVGDCRSKANAAFQAWMRNDTPISTNLRNTAYCYGVRLGGAAEWQFVYEKFKNQTNVATESIKLLNALSCTRETWLLRTLLAYSLNPSEIRRQDAVSAIVYVSNNPLGKYLAWNFVREQWDFMYAQFGYGSFSFSNLVSGVLKSFNTEYQLSEVIDFGTKNRDKLGSASRAFEQAKERIQNNINFLSANEKKIDDWFKTLQ